MADAEDEECADSSRSSIYLSGQRDATTTGGREEGIAEEELGAGGGRKKSQGRNREGGRKEPIH